MEETIYALASGAGRAGVAVIRISGPDAGRTLSALTRMPPPAPRRARRTRLHDPVDGAPLDDGLVLWFPGPASYTGEDVAELHVHGGPAVIAALLDVLGRLPGLRLAEPGEFTRRAFLAGKIDLTEAEGLIDLVNAETEAQRRQALRQSEGALGRLYESWRARLLLALAHFEAAIDFPDEDLPETVADSVRVEISGLLSEMTQHLDDDQRGERLRDGLEIVILGPPNVGKSSLLNLLARREAAIVSAEAGTTRDVVEVRMDLEGYPVVLADTAGIRESADAVETEGVRRARQRAGTADLRILVTEAGRGFDPDLADADTMLVVNKIDLLAGTASEGVCTPAAALGTYPLSVRTGEGVDAFLAGLAAAVRARIGVTAAPAITRARHREVVADCAAALDRALTAPLPELAAEDLRLAMRALGRITGRVDAEDLLDVIFRDFCIGK